MRILMLSPEATPFAKTGGLGDMVSSLSKTLAAAGHEVHLFLPLYGHILPGPDWTAHPDPVAVHLSPRNTLFCRVWSAPFHGTIAHFLEYNNFFGTSQIYGEPVRDAYRFTFQTAAALDFCLQTGWIPDIVHAHDWTTGLAPVLLNTTRRGTSIGNAASVFTIHNLRHQGLVPAGLMPWHHLPSWLYTADNLECFGGINLMKGALYHATKITTVSPNYAREIQTPAYGCGLDPVLRFRASNLRGVLNGLDLDEWNPATDPRIAAKFTSGKDLTSGKAANKAALQCAYQLDPDPGTPVFGIISRLFDQKGLDWVADILPGLLGSARMQFVLLGTGEKWLEARFAALAARFPGKCGVSIAFDDSLSHLIEAGSDFFLMPSRFEPCGLNQMYSMRYGTLPIARATGGLADTVLDWGEPGGGGTGIVFNDPNADALLAAVHRALQLYFDYPAHFDRLRRNAMSRDFSWANSAKEYERIYAVAIRARRPGSV